MAGLLRFLNRNAGNDHVKVETNSSIDVPGHFVLVSLIGIRNYNDDGSSTVFASPLRNTQAQMVSSPIGQRTLHAPIDIGADWIGHLILDKSVVAKSVTLGRLGHPTVMVAEVVGTFQSEDEQRGIVICLTPDYNGQPSFGADVHNVPFAFADLPIFSISVQHGVHQNTILQLLDKFYKTLEIHSGFAGVNWRPSLWDFNEIYMVVGGFDTFGANMSYIARDTCCAGSVFVKKCLHRCGKGICSDLGWAQPGTSPANVSYGNAYAAYLYVKDYDNAVNVVLTLNELLPGSNITMESISPVWKEPSEADRAAAATFDIGLLAN